MLYIKDKLGEYYIKPPDISYQKIFNQSNEKNPIVFILSPGADPLFDIQQLGEKVGFSGNKFKPKSLGQGMGPESEELIRNGAQRGHWVMLQNCHLLTSWLKNLEKTLDDPKVRNPNKDFRLWLTT
jgi:dynein heavy chain